MRQKPRMVYSEPAISLLLQKDAGELAAVSVPADMSLVEMRDLLNEFLAAMTARLDDDTAQSIPVPLDDAATVPESDDTLP